MRKERCCARSPGRRGGSPRGWESWLRQRSLVDLAWSMCGLCLLELPLLTCWPPAEALRARQGPIGRQARLVCAFHAAPGVSTDEFGFREGLDICLMSSLILWDSYHCLQGATWWPGLLSGAGSHGYLTLMCELPLNFPQWQETVGPMSLYFDAVPLGCCWPYCSGSMSRQ